MTPEDYLRQKDWQYRFAPGQLQVKCVFCGDTNKYGHLYINRETGLWKCHRCGEQGNFYQLQTRLGDTPEPIWKDQASRFEVWEHLVSVCQDALLDEPDAIEYLRKERHLSPETIGKYRIGWAPRNIMDLLLKDYSLGELSKAGLVSDKNYPIFWDRVLVPYIQDGQVVALRGKQIGGNMLQAKDSSIRLFGVDNLKDQYEAYLCEGEMDAMLLDQMGYPAVAIPGALSFQEHWISYFDDCRRVFVCLDTDEAGQQGAAKIVHLVGPKAKTVNLPLPDGAKSTDITEFFYRDHHTKDEFDELVDSVRGQRLYTHAESIVAYQKLMDSQGIQLGLGLLDEYLHPGLLPGQVLILLGKSGSGKTQFLLQTIHNLSGWSSFDKTEGGPASPVLLLSLEQTRAEIANRLLRMGKFHNPWATDDEVAYWHRHLRVVDENRIPSGEVGVLVDEFIAEVGRPPAVLYVDYLGYWARTFRGGSKYEQVTEAVMELKAIAKQYEMPVIVPHQVNRLQKRGDLVDMDAARDSGAVEETADILLGVSRPADKEENQDALDFRVRSTVRVYIGKSRHGHAGRWADLYAAPFSLTLTDLKGTREEMVEREWLMYDRNRPYSEVLKYHTREFIK